MTRIKIFVTLLVIACSSAINIRAQDSLNVSLLGRLGQTIGYDTYGKVTLRNSLAYACKGEDGLQVIDISNPHLPQIVGSYYQYYQIHSVFLQSNYAYASASYQIPPDGEWVSNIIVLNIANTANIQVVGGCISDYQTGMSFANGNRLYVADGLSGVKLYNITYPNNPQLLSTYDTPGSVWDIFVAGNYVYVADYNGGLRILEYTAPQTLTEVGSLAIGNVSNVKVSGNYAYFLVNNYYPNNSFLKIADISNPSNPVVLGSIPFVNSSYDLDVLSGFVFVATYQMGIRIIDVNNPSQPIETGYYITPFYAWGIAVSGDIACVGNMNYFCVYDISQAVPNSDDTIIPALSDYLVNGYPNPFIKDLNIKIDSNTPINSDISIYNLKGQLIRTWKDVKADELTWDGKDTSNQSVSSGIYIIKARQGKDISTAKVLKY